MNGRQARVKCSRSGRRPARRQRSVGLAPPPSLLHDSPVPSMEGRGQCDPPFSPPPPLVLRGRLHRAAPGFPPHPKPLSPPRPPTPATLERTAGTCARSPRLSAARSWLPRRVPPHHSRLTRPPAPRAHRLASPPVLVQTCTRLAPVRRDWSSGHRRGRPRLPRGASPLSPSRSRPARRPPAQWIPAPARDRPRALLATETRSPHA